MDSGDESNHLLRANLALLPAAGASVGIDQYAWDFGDGMSNSPCDGDTATHVWSAPGVYTVTVVMSDGTGASIFGLTQIRIDPASP
jgi:PKD repeat protein